MAARPERRPGMAPPRRGFPFFKIAVAGGSLLSIAAVAAAWWALREPEATAGRPGSPPAALRSTAASALGGAPGTSGLPVAPPDARAAESAGDDDSIDEPVLPSDSGGLTRADVVAAVNAVRPQLSRCGRDPSLIGVVKMTVSSSGKVVNAQVFGGIAGTSAGECVAEVARGAVFRSSRREQTVVSWPVALGRSTSFSVSGPAPEEPAPESP